MIPVVCESNTCVLKTTGDCLTSWRGVRIRFCVLVLTSDHSLEAGHDQLFPTGVAEDQFQVTVDLISPSGQMNDEYQSCLLLYHIYSDLFNKSGI